MFSKVILFLGLISFVFVNAGEAPKIKFNFPDKEAMDVCQQYIEGLIELDFAKISKVIVNDTNSVTKTFELVNHHIKADWNGTVQRNPNGRYAIGGFTFKGYSQFQANAQQIAQLLQHQCSLSDQNIYIERFLSDNRMRPYYGKYSKMCIWRGFIAGIVREEFNFPGFEKVTMENGYYTMSLARDPQTGKLLVEKVVAVDLEVPIPEMYWADLYAETNLKKRCKLLQDIVDPKLDLYKDFVEYVSGETIQNKN